MSFVSVMASSNFINVVSDGRVSLNGVPLQENYKKFKKISEKQFIAYAGSKEVCENVVNQVDYQESKVYDLRQVAQEIQAATSGSGNLSLYGHKMLFCVGGVNANRRIEFYTVENGSSNIGEYKPSSSTDINYAFMSTNTSDQLINEKLHEIASFMGTESASRCLQVQKELNNFVAGIDFTVNTNVSTLTIK